MAALARRQAVSRRAPIAHAERPFSRSLHIDVPVHRAMRQEITVMQKHRKKLIPRYGPFELARANFRGENRCRPIEPREKNQLTDCLA